MRFRAAAAVATHRGSPPITWTDMQGMQAAGRPLWALRQWRRRVAVVWAAAACSGEGSVVGMWGLRVGLLALLLGLHFMRGRALEALGRADSTAGQKGRQLWLQGTGRHIREGAAIQGRRAGRRDHHHSSSSSSSNTCLASSCTLSCHGQEAAVPAAPTRCSSSSHNSSSSSRLSSSSSMSVTIQGPVGLTQHHTLLLDRSSSSGQLAATAGLLGMLATTAAAAAHTRRRVPHQLQQGLLQTAAAPRPPRAAQRLWPLACQPLLS
jgi:hypothetical protein